MRRLLWCAPGALITDQTKDLQINPHLPSKFIWASRRFDHTARRSQIEITISTEFQTSEATQSPSLRRMFVCNKPCKASIMSVGVYHTKDCISGRFRSTPVPSRDGSYLTIHRRAEESNGWYPPLESMKVGIVFDCLAHTWIPGCRCTFQHIRVRYGIERLVVRLSDAPRWST